MSLPKKYDPRFDEDYFEHGVEKKIGLYENFHWQPWRSFGIAGRLMGLYPNQVILDYGCAKGYIVKALRVLGAEAYGYDVSEYALSQAPEEVRDYLYKPGDVVPKVDTVFAKDVFEHVEPDKLPELLTNLRPHCRNLFAIVPLGDGGKYRIAE